jgi:ABC-2 type transport system ATP-binding protein
MSLHQTAHLAAQPVPPAASDLLAVETVGLGKSFRRTSARGVRRRTGAPRHRTVAALDGLSLSMRRGETLAVLGQNGSGKSTLIRILSTLLLHDAGTARVFGYDVRRQAHDVQRLVNRVSVEASFFKKMSAAENLAYAARFYGMGPGATAAQIPRILERVGFPSSRRGEPMENLSRGMQQKVALARALLTSPVLLLLDEPTTGLDPRSKREVQEFIRQMRVTHDSTVLLCTHDLAEAESLADRVGILDRGRLLVLEPPDELIRRYGATSLEDAFFRATGRDLGPDDEDGGSDEHDDLDREVFT